MALSSFVAGMAYDTTACANAQELPRGHTARLGQRAGMSPEREDSDAMSNAAAFGIGVAVGFGLSLARLGLWLSALRPKTPKSKVVVVVSTALVIPAAVSFAMPTFIAGLLVWLGAAAGAGIAAPIVLPLAHFFFGRNRPRPSSSDTP